MTDSARLGPGYLLGGRYLLAERLGRGGMATVWRATDQLLRREVAVKIVAPMEDAEVTAERFRREALVTAALNHPNIVTIFDAGVDAGSAYLVMELLSGRTLAEELRSRGPFPVEEVRSIALQVTGALGAAHAAGLVHRDIKPGNIARTADGSVKVLDFGISHIIDEGAAGQAPLTATGAVVGTASYLAPEQARGERVDQRADLYALGCVLYALLAGEPPFQGPTAVATMMAHLSDPVPDLRAARPETPPELADLIQALLAKDPEDRPESAAAVAEALRGEGPALGLPLAPPASDQATVVLPTSPPATMGYPTRAYTADQPEPVTAERPAELRPVAAQELDAPGPARDEVEKKRGRGPLVALVLVAALLLGAWWLINNAADLGLAPVRPASPSPNVEAPQPGEETTAPPDDPEPGPTGTPTVVESSPAAEPGEAPPAETTAPAPTTAAPAPTTEQAPPPAEEAPPAEEPPPPATEDTAPAGG